MDETPKSHVILVHGTFARKADWINPGSLICDRFIDQEVIRFRWSGRNSHKRRHLASLQLSHLLQQDIVDHPQVPRFIIAHSHGGNVALRAIQGLKDQKGISGLICMGTPFLGYRVKSSSFVVEMLGSLARYSLAFFLLIAVFMSVLFTVDWFSNSRSVFGATAVMIIASLLLLCAIRLLVVLVTLLGKVAKRVAVRPLTEYLSSVQGIDIPILNVQIARDEARGLLKAFEAPAKIGESVWNWLITPISLFCLFAALLFLTEDDNGNLNALVGIVGLILVIGIPIIFLAPILRSHPGAFGWEGLLAHLWLEVTLSESPEVTGEVQNYRLKNSDSSSLFRHSRFYDDPEVITAIERFVAEHANPASSSGKAIHNNDRN